MKSNKPLWKLLMFLFITQGTLYAQDPIAVCTKNQRTAAKMLSQENLSNQDKATIYNLVKPCADQGDINAICHLGILFKDGIGVAQDFDKALEYFIKSADAGHEKAKFAIGYFYLKGLGSLEQDYQKAVEIFDDGVDAMSTHWLAYCTYFGFGTERNDEEAIDMLAGNLIYNSEVLMEQFAKEFDPEFEESYASQWNTIPANLAPIAKYNDLLSTTGNSQLLPPAESGTYAGHFVEYEWSGEKVIRYIPFEIEADVLDDAGNINILMTVQGEVVQGNGRWENGILYFDNLQFDLPRQYTDHEDHNSIKYNLRKITFQPIPFNGINYLAGILDATIENWKEPSNPMLILINQTKKAEDDTIVSELQKQSEVIKIYPNPFQTGFTIGYELPKDALVGISISNMTATISQEVFSASQAEGFHTFSIPNFPFPAGTYLVWLWVDGKLDSRTIIKQ